MKRIICLFLFWILSATLLLTFSADILAAEEITALERGQELFRAGDLNQALAVLRTSVRQIPDSPETARVYALIGRIFIQQRNYADAILYLQYIPKILRSPEIELLLGTSLVETGNYTEGLRLLRPLFNEPLCLTDKTILYHALVVASIEKRQFLRALFYLQQQLPFSLTPAAILGQAHQLFQNRISDVDLAEAAFMWQGTAIGQDARLQLARRALVQQQSDLARQHLQKLSASAVSFPYWQEAELLLQRISVDNWLSRDSIGILLPLSGRYSSYGELVKKGLELALQEHNKIHLPARFIYRDTAIEGTTSAQLVSGLTDDDKVMAIIGPLLRTAAEGAARRSQREMVPLLALSQNEGLPEIGNFIFHDTLTSEQQVAALVSHAMATGHISFSILHPNNLLGKQMTALFIAELQKTGGEIVDIISYPEDNTDFKKQIQQLLWEDREIPSSKEKTGEVAELEYPLAPFHALFIPDYADRIKLIAPQLMFYGIKDVTLLGINGWNSPELIGRAGRFLKDAVFVDAFYPDSKNSEVQHFMELYCRTYQEEPTILGAQAFEAATLLLQIIDDPQVSNRDDLRRKLVGLKNFRGITGTTSFDMFGEAIKQLYLLQVKRGRIVECR